MFERYTESARRTIFFARYEASQFGAPAIEPEHLLLGLVREDKTLGASVFGRQVDVAAMRKEIEGRTLLREKISTTVELPLSPEAKRVLAYAHEESDSFQHRHIGTEHLLLGLLREDRSIAAKMLYERGLRINNIRDVVAYWRSPATALTIINRAVGDDPAFLDLSAYGLKEVPEELSQLRLLKGLNLAGNQLRALPEFIGQFSELTNLDLSDNLLTALPDSLMSLRSLSVLYLHGNDLDVPEEILGPDRNSDLESVPPASILEYYYRVKTGQRSLNEAKLILVGRGAVGKTSIVNRLVFNFFKDEAKTEGIQITKWNMRLDRDELVRLNIWDFGGQEIMHATHQFFLTNRSLYLLVLTGSRAGGEEAEAEYWLKLIESFGEGSPVIVVMNKSKEYAFDLNRRALQQKYPNICDFIKTDCSDATGIHLLRRAIKNETNHLENLRVPFPANWFSIKEKLAVMKENYLSFEEFREQCSLNGEKDPKAQDALASYLHNLGIVLNYKDDPRLQDTYVLNPHSVTNGIYTILNSEKLRENFGELNLKDLTEILGSEDYPMRMSRFLFDLMKKFDLCFSFPDDDCHYLIPELLGNQEPAEAILFKPEECLNFQYHYSVLPEGLLPRFIVRTHVLSEMSPRWRSGVILDFEGNRALVKGDMHERKVLISVSGPAPGRRRLLAIIRSDFEHIHRDIQNLRPQEMIPLTECPNILIPYEKLLAMERAGVEEFPEFVGGGVIKLNVNGLLNGVDIISARLREVLANEPLSSIRLFYSYSHRDENLRDQLNTHLKLMQRQGLIKSWHDRNIDAGDNWRREIDENLDRADIILLLVSANFIASDYCYEKEMKRALERHANGEAQVVPIIIRDVYLKGAPFADIQYLPTNGKAITLWRDRDAAWRNVSEGIGKLVETILQRRINKAAE